MNFFFTSITWLGSLYILLPIGVLCLFFTWQFEKTDDGSFLLLSLIVTSLITHLLKLLFARPRPANENLSVTMPKDFSFPSAHTSQIAAFATASGILADMRLQQPITIILFTLLFFLVLLVGYSRVYLQVHYMSDVVAGGLLALVVVSCLSMFIGPPIPHP